jgi:hypothetical protein
LRASRATLGVLVAGALAWGGCSLLIDLGPEAQLRAAASGDEAGLPEAGIDAPAEAAPTSVCGLTASPNASCAACIQNHCCDVSKTCAADPECVAGLECIKNCLAQIECIIQCLGNKNLLPTTTCSQQLCPDCTPTDECAKLGQCCLATYGQGDAGSEQRILHDVCRGIILDNDSTACGTHLDAIKPLAEAAPICNGRLPEAGAD